MPFKIVQTYINDQKDLCNVLKGCKFGEVGEARRPREEGR